MCGIAGIRTFGGGAVLRDTVKRMTDSIQHRGPDGEGQYVHGPIGLGHRRLAIIDLSSAGANPMANEDETVWVVFNGEIYNFGDIRPELQRRGHVFRSKTDTEVILHAYEEWGVDCLKRFNGMFAFALWDEKRQRLWLARDRLGVKPLFYAQLPEAVLFGSEIKAILASGMVERVLDYQALASYLALNYMPAPRTLFNSIRQVLPGHYLLIDAEGSLQDVEYWDIAYEEDQDRGESYYLRRLEELLDDSVRLRLISDVPFGAFLSGGVDSSTVVHTMSKHLSQPVKTFTIGFDDDASFDERPYAREVATLVGAEHTERKVHAHVADVLPRIVWHAEEPTADSSMVALYHIAKVAREHVTMALSGDGGDEILAGYETYQAHYIHRLYRMIPASFRRLLFESAVNRLPVSYAKVSWDFKLRRFIKAGNMDSDAAHASWRTIFATADREALLAPVWGRPGVDADIVDLYREQFARTNAKHPLNRMLYVDTRFYLPNDMLVKVDRMTMAHSLEAREPLLDYRLVEFAATVPPRYKLKQLRHKKYLLKKSMQGKLPDRVLWRKKAGFNVPVAHWINSNLREFVSEHLSPRRIREMAIFDEKVVEKLLVSHFNRQADYSHQIWCLLILSLWWQQFMVGGELPGSANQLAGMGVGSLSGRIIS
jgi:asparagine synthase (glutamine-hydrolysing)